MSESLLTWPELSRLVPYSRVHIGRLEHAGQFPLRLQIGPGRVAWRLTEIEDWLASRGRGALTGYGAAAAHVAYSRARAAERDLPPAAA